MYNLNGMLANMYLSKDQPMKYFVATMRCDQFDSLDKILTETKVNAHNPFSKKSHVWHACNPRRSRCRHIQTVASYFSQIIALSNGLEIF